MSDDKVPKRIGPLRMDWSISIADLLAISLAIGSIVYQYASLERRMDVLQAEQVYLKAGVIEANRALDQFERDVSGQLREINTNVAKLVGREEGRAEAAQGGRR